jgi:hypothetical protein
MSNRAATLKQSDLTRYAKAMQAAGVAEWRLDLLPDGTQSIIVGKQGCSKRGPNPDDLLK